MFRSSAPPLRIALRDDPFLPPLAALGLFAVAAGVVLYALVYSGWIPALLTLVLSLVAAAWSMRLRGPDWDWLGFDILPTAKAGGFLLRDAHARARECSLRH